MVDVRGSLSGITKRFSRRGRWVLGGIDLELVAGSRTVIVGRNGSGKSTLLRICAGVSVPNNGTVELPDRIGYVPERLAARTRFTGTEYLAHMGRIKGLHAEVINERSRELLGRFDLQPSPKEPIDSLSKGNRQKLVIAQAFLGPVELLVLDEPFSALDPVAHAALGELTSEAQSGGTAVLISSHHVQPEQAGQIQLGIHDGQLAEIRHDWTLRGVTAGALEVELVPTERALDRERVASLSGVSLARFEQSKGVLVLLTNQLHIDRVLTAAIAQGWSVRSVREQLREGRLG
jgi:ABC-2 type transport system ATP-binding protein